MKVWKFEVATSRAIVIGLGLGMVFMSLVFGWGGYELLLQFSFKIMVRLIPDTPIWHMWQSLPMPIYIKFYVFNISNANQLNEQAVPKLKEMGPYVYTIDYDKIDIDVDEDRDLVGYRHNRSYHFQREMSAGSEHDTFTFINFMFLGVSNMAHELKDVDAAALDEMLTESGETITKTATVRQFLFDGISIAAYDNILKTLAEKMEGDIVLPQQMTGGAFALLKGKNGSDDGKWVVHNGYRRPSDFGRIASINGKKELNIWKGSQCNVINGTDGIIFPPFISPGKTKLGAFSVEMCRSIRWEYQKKVITEGIPTLRHRLVDFLSVQQNSILKCFCPYEDSSRCNITGFAYLAPCYGGFPIIISKPHFYNVDPVIRKRVKGLTPVDRKHESYIDVHQETGAPIRTFTRVQYSIELVNWPDMPSFVNVNRGFVPFAWFDKEADLDWFNTFLLWVVELSRKYWSFLRWLIMTFSVGVVGFGVVLVLMDFRQPVNVDVKMRHVREAFHKDD